MKSFKTGFIISLLITQGLSFAGYAQTNQKVSADQIFVDKPGVIR